MGLFDRKNKNEENKEVNEAPKKKEVTFPFLTILVEEVLSMTSTEVSIIGNVRGATLHEGDELYLLGRKGKSVRTSAVRIEDTLMSRMEKAEEGTNVSVVLEGLRSGDVEKYDVLSSVNCLSSDTDTPDSPVNPFLTGLLREGNGKRDDRDFMGRFVEYIATEAIFLTPAMHDPNKESKPEHVGVAVLRGKDGKNYLSAFTDIHELEIMEGLPEKLIQPLDFEKICKIVLEGPIDGLLINPKTAGFVMTKPLIQSLQNHKRKVDNHIKEQKIDTKQPMMLAVPKEDHIPQELFDSLRAYMTTEPKILRAWYAMMVFPKDNDRRSHLVIVDTLEETPEIFGAIGRAAREYVGDMQLNMQAASKVGSQMTDKMMLFYERKDNISV
ncbi:MAG: enhanced serine sensitivity protein SseB C-terminal domain-containing protein [Clostridiales bacterium]|nr:enhanced serine sensitivity protein SseB C-terminal domain-containing protein [Clostridiales bacterium]MBR5974746.1 enhanced serine sensitivity protein SseB C-terminal domain-containing protein [Clostridiales bacterium]